VTEPANLRQTVRLGPRSLGRTRYRFALLGLALAMAFGFFGYFVYSASRATERARGEAEREMRTLASVLADQADNLLARVEFVVTTVANEAGQASSPEGWTNQTHLAALLGRLLIADGGFRSFAAFDRQSILAASAGAPPRDMPKAVIDAVARAIANPETGTTILRPLIVDEGPALFAVAPIAGALPGQVIGAIAAEMPAAVFARFYSGLEDGRGKELALIDSRGWVVVRTPDDARYMDRPLENLPFAGLIAAVEAARGASVQRIVVGLDGVERVSIARPVADRPFAVVAGAPSKNFLAEWRASLGISMPFSALVVAAFLFLLLSLGRHLGRVEDSEASLLESERRFQTLVGNVPGIVFQRVQSPGKNAQFVWISEGVERQLGLTREAALRGGGRLLNEYTHPRDLESLRRAYMRSAEDLQPIHWTGRVRHCGGDQRWFEITSRPRRLPDGTVVWEGIALDSTERKRAEDSLAVLREQLEAKRAQLELALANMAQGIAVYDRRMRLIVRNARYLELFDLTEAQAREGTSLIDLLRVSIGNGHYEDDAAREAIRGRIRGARSRTPTAIVQRLKDGRVIDVSMRPIEGGGHVATFTDITAREATEAALRDAKETAELADRAKSQFLANMSHELRTPLNAIIGFAEIMNDNLFGPLGDPRYVEYIKDIEESGKHLLTLINDILDLSKIEANETALREEQVDLGGVFESCARLVRERAQRARVELHVPSGGDMPVVWADRGKLKQILLNLLSNAVKFTPAEGKVDVETGLAPNGGVFVRVRDTGIGMRREDIPLALQPFRQIENTLARKHQGTGLGLPLSISLARMHGGDLEIESEPDKGTTVTLRLPADRTVAPHGARETEPSVAEFLAGRQTGGA
jgi:PAS domain S-box-containing protein